MIGGLVAFIVVIAVMIAVPTAIYSVVRALGLARRSPFPPALSTEVETRLRRMEEAIDAMAQEIERLRVPDRYVPGESSERKQLPPPNEPPTFR